MKSVLVGIGVVAVVVWSAAAASAKLSPFENRISADDNLGFVSPSAPTQITQHDVSRLSTIAALTDYHCGLDRDDVLVREPYDFWPVLALGRESECSSGVEWVFPTSTKDPGTVIVNGVLKSDAGAGNNDDRLFGIDVRSIIRSGNTGLELLGVDAAKTYGPAVSERIVTLRIAPKESRHSASNIPGTGTLALIGAALLVIGLAAWRFGMSARTA